MPRILPDRWQPESIREFRASARQRFDDALACAGQGRRTGAIYLLGYSAEMLLKGAYFSALGHGETATLGWRTEILPAIHRGRNTFVIPWPPQGQGHNVRAWAELLIVERAHLGTPYSSPFDTDLQARGQRIGDLWSETLRYHKNVAYLHELRKVREAVEWLLANEGAHEELRCRARDLI
jgi:hypothetical protein